ncbi:hypothetical protein NDU88_001567 [Pleurodeles waltl]|uniref:Uncharacterized protein n=1 Tax=Pleurodeles waltl TaxID=8319 RepID=A0AAV7P8B6_PLEWA|nr:hypothetical protein NDU88_001567 [Pleurodeles waltl]
MGAPRCLRIGDPPPPPLQTWSASFSAAGVRLAVGARILDPLWPDLRTRPGATLTAAEEGLAPGVTGGLALCWGPGRVPPPQLGIQPLSPCAYLPFPPPSRWAPCCYGERLWTARDRDGWAHRTFLGGGCPDTLVGAGTPVRPLLPVTIGNSGWKGLQLSQTQCREAQEGGCPHDLSGTPHWTASQTLCSLPAVWDGAWQIDYTDGVATRDPGLIAVILEARLGPWVSGTTRLGRRI